MTALSSDDKMKLRVSAKRVEAWNRYKLKPAQKVKRCTLTVFSPNKDKGAETIRPDKMEVMYRDTDGYAMRSADAKVSKNFLRRGDSFHDYGHDLPEQAPIGASAKAVKAGNTIVYKQAKGLPMSKPRGDSPFKKKGAKASFVVERK